MAAGMELFRYFSDLVEERRARPGADLLSALIAAEAEGDRLSHAELLSTVTLLFVAGFETTMNLLGNGMLALLRNPSEIDRLRADPTLVRTGVEELIRYDGPVHITARIATTDVEIGGRRIREGDQFPDPDRLDVGRTPNRHLGLGGGPHFCLGATLARIESQAAFGAVLRRFPHLELATENPTYRDHFVIRGLTGLRVRVTPPA
jgi:cytochrome P450